MCVNYVYSIFNTFVNSKLDIIEVCFTPIGVLSTKVLIHKYIAIRKLVCSFYTDSNMYDIEYSGRLLYERIAYLF